MKMKHNKVLYWSLIGVFILLYTAVAFVSTLHAITFFKLANTLGLAILLGAAYEIGQASVLFAILTTDNKNKILAWGMMFLLTGLQVTANVYASFKFMDMSGSNDWTYWQRAILFGVQADSPEMYKVIISWISGALLPIIALGMTALVAENIRLAKDEKIGENYEKEKETKEELDELDHLLDLQVEPKVEPKLEEPKVEPKLEEPKLEEPKVEPKLEEPKVEPKLEEPKVEPKLEEPKLEEPKVESKLEIETNIESITNEIDKEISERIKDPPIPKKA